MSQGAPSVINGGGGVGATELLRGSAGESFEIDMTKGGVKDLAGATAACEGRTSHDINNYCQDDLPADASSLCLSLYPEHLLTQPGYCADADDVEKILRDTVKLASVSHAAYRKSRSWGATENAQMLAHMINDAMNKRNSITQQT
jgi:hypothetical protein